MCAELSDGYPSNITIASNTTVETTGYFDDKFKKEMQLKCKRTESVVEGFILGDHKGRTAGRIGSIVEMDWLLYLPYSRVPEKYFDGEESKVNEMAVLVFNKNQQIQKKYPLGSGTPSYIYLWVILIMSKEFGTFNEVGKRANSSNYLITYFSYSALLLFELTDVHLLVTNFLVTDWMIYRCAKS